MKSKPKGARYPNLTPRKVVLYVIGFVLTFWLCTTLRNQGIWVDSVPVGAVAAAGGAVSWLVDKAIVGDSA
jgi:hypothetical protein